MTSPSKCQCDVSYKKHLSREITLQFLLNTSGITLILRVVTYIESTVQIEEVQKEGQRNFGVLQPTSSSNSRLIKEINWHFSRPKKRHVILNIEVYNIFDIFGQRSHGTLENGNHRIVFLETKTSENFLFNMRHLHAGV